MQVGESTLKTLVEGQKQFQIPLYQRQYSWDTPQLSQLWEDVLEQYDLLTPDETGHLPEAPPNHFLGSTVLAPSPMMQAHGVTPFLVIDGQQRLTTLLIAICALRDHAAIDDPSAAERFNELYLINKFATGDARYRLLPTQSDRASFFACVDGDGSSRVGRIGKAYGFFRAQLSQLGPDNQPLTIERLETVLWQRLVFVAITTDSGDNVHRIFESLNDRGVRLTQADLLRNYVFMLLPSHSEEVYVDVWLPMQELLSPQQLETLAYLDLVLRGRSAVKREDIYRAQQERLAPLAGNEDAVTSELRDLARLARLFRRIVVPQDESNREIRAALQRLERWGASTTHALLLHLYDVWDKGDCTAAEVKDSLAYIESFLVRRTIAAVPTNNLNRIFAAIVSQLPSELSLAEAVRYALSTERKFWPSDQRLREAIRSRPFYYQGRQEQKMLILQRLEESFEDREPVDWQAAQLSIEHVMPQGLTDEWRAMLSADGDDPEQVHLELVHTLGNLTVTAYNGELSNHPFERKKGILGGSSLALNRAISPEGRWTKSEIQARADELADRAIRLWPAPIADVQEEPTAVRDWSGLHAALAALPHGTWTSYTDLAELIGSHPVPVGQHIASVRGVLNGHRVLNSDGHVAPGFRWLDPDDDRDIFDVLRAESIRFDDSQRADPTQHLKAEVSQFCLGMY